MEVLERALEWERCGRSIVHLEVGEPDFPTPEIIVEAGVKALRSGHTRYTHSLGHIELREAISDWYAKELGIAVPPEQIIVTVGSSGAMLLSLAAVLDPGSQVLMSDPHYACYPSFVSSCGGITVRLPVFQQEGFQLDPEQVAQALTPSTRVLMLNSPANPTGAVIAEQDLSKLVEIVDGKAIIISDEIYQSFVYEGRSPSILEFTSDAIVINGFSKRFSMTGWRLGYAILPKTLIRSVQKLQQNLFISPPDFAQIAAITALSKAGAAAEKMKIEYGRRRQLVLKRLEDMGLTVPVPPAGAFYIFVHVGRYSDNILDFAFKLLDREGVAVAPGIDFGPSGDTFIRICYANSMENLQEGMDRMERFLTQL